ncbi:putative dTDP-glucose 4-6-dehydratase domain protein, partial [Vibrio parahaemolyticus V-223/04]
ASRLSLMTKSISLFMRRAMQAHIISNTILLGLFRPTLLEP